MAKLPNGDKATADIRKFTHYCLNPEHRKGGADKARVFKPVLGLTLEHAEQLCRACLAAASESSEAEFKGQRFVESVLEGDRYEIVFAMEGPNGSTADVTSSWIVDAETGIPRLTSCYIQL